MTTALYLHGFRSRTFSPKIAFLTNEFKKHGVEMVALDMAQPNFENLSIEAMTYTLVEALKKCGNDTTAITHSMGTLPLLNAVNSKIPGTEKIKNMILTGPLLNYLKKDGRLQSLSDPYFKDWKNKGYKEFDHHSTEPEKAKLNYSFVEEAVKYNAEDIIIDRPTLIIHGDKDEIVSIEDTRKFVQYQNNVELITVEGGDHDLYGYLQPVWNEMEKFIFGR